MMKSSSRSAFTIVELLIVIVIITILAAITIVAYNGITNQAKETTLKSDLHNAVTALELANTNDGSYPQNPSLKSSESNHLQYSGGGSSFCITATTTSFPGKSYFITQGAGIKEGICPDHVQTIAGTMQSFSQNQCQSLPLFTGSNNTAVIGLTDARGGTIRTYRIAKLADNKCWMLNNLKLGSTTASITLTPQDSNIASNFTLPQITHSGNSLDIPYTYGPVPGDTGLGSTNYGYLYNWSAATAGETRISKPAGSGNASYSICPANWRLPSGGVWNTPANEFSNLNARMAGLSGVTDARYTESNNYGPTFYPRWQSDGLFKGVLSGYWWSGFDSQSSAGVLWSRSTYPTSADDGYVAYFDTANIDSSIYGIRSYGYGIRCVLN